MKSSKLIRSTGPPRAKWHLPRVHPPAAPPAQEGRQGPDQLRRLHLPPLPRPARALGATEGGSCEDGRGEGSAGTSSDRGRERGGLPSTKSSCHTGRDTALPSKAARVRAEERRRGDED